MNLTAAAAAPTDDLDKEEAGRQLLGIGYGKDEVRNALANCAKGSSVEALLE